VPGSSRSRTENWRQSLDQLKERNGALEITLPRFYDGGAPDTGAGGSDLIWRVRILGISDTELLVEQPSVLGRTIELEANAELVAIIAIGQNRWMFRTTVLGKQVAALNARVQATCIRIAMPDAVERCQRRNFYRVSTVGLHLPEAEAFPLLDIASAGPAEDANRAEVLHAQNPAVAGRIGPVPAPATPAAVGPPIRTVLINLGGGGAGLLVAPEDRGTFEAHNLFWIRVRLDANPQVVLGIVARVRHRHIDSSQRLYAGMQFEFAHKADHEAFVVDQICRYVAGVQREQLARQSIA
jgi:c-di-GMP-binding flagellar brake protein YcgR